MSREYFPSNSYKKSRLLGRETAMGGAEPHSVGHRRSEVLRHVPPAERIVEDRSLIMCQLCSYVPRHSSLVVDGLCVGVVACRKRQREGASIDYRLDVEERHRAQDPS